MREILRKADKLGQGVSALPKFSMVMFREGDTGPGCETGRREMISVEVGIKGDENDFRCLGRSGVMMADREDPIITVQVQPPGAFDIENLAWKKVATAAASSAATRWPRAVSSRLLASAAARFFAVADACVLSGLLALAMRCQVSILAACAQVGAM